MLGRTRMCAYFSRPGMLLDRRGRRILMTFRATQFKQHGDRARDVGRTNVRNKANTCARLTGPRAAGRASTPSIGPTGRAVRTTKYMASASGAWCRSARDNGCRSVTLKRRVASLYGLETI